MNKVLLKNTVRTIARTSSRFFSLVLIVALGISFFAGMNAVAPDMLETASEYYKDTNAADITIVSTAGLTDEDVAVIKSIQGIESVSGQKFVDGVASVNSEKISDIDGSRMTIRAYALDVTKASMSSLGEDDRSYINRPQLVKGSWPSAANQCVVDQSVLSTPQEFEIGSVIEIEGDGADINGKLANTQYTIVGIIRTPLYISYERGNTTIGTGKLGTFFYIPEENFRVDYYSSVSIKILGSDNYDPYSDEYDRFIEPYITYLSSISSERLAPRVEALKTEYAETIEQSELDYANAKTQVETQISEGEEQVKLILDMAQNGDVNLAEYKRQYNEKALEAESKIGENKLEHSSQYAEWQEKRNEYNEAKALVDKYSTAQVSYKNAQTEYNVAKVQVTTSLQTVNYLERLVATTRDSIAHLDNTQSNQVSDIINRFEQSGLVGVEVDNIISSINSLTAVGTAEEISAYMEPELQSLQEQLAAAKKDLSDANTELAEKKAALDSAKVLVDKLNKVDVSLKSAEAELAEAEQKLTSAGYDIQLGELEVLSQLSDLKNQITNYETNLIIAKEKASTVEAEFEQSKQAAYKSLENAKYRLEDTKNFMLNLDNAKWYVNDRKEALLGYDDYKMAADRTAAISIIFPWFFFIVAALVCLNTMTRMVDDERTQLGTFKALGFYNSEIILKYVIYAFIASFVGAFAGSFLGFAVFPAILTEAFGILYDLPTVIIRYRFSYAAIGIIISVGVTVLATYFSAKKALETHPSMLMKPKAPKGGKRIALEKFPRIWSRLNFTAKVTCRNVFRNKKRFIMAVVGVMGCTALLVAAFGFDHSINATIKYQFTDSDSVWCYDMQTVLNGSYDTTVTECKAINTLRERPEISDAMLEYMKVYNTTSAKTDEEFETYILVPEDETSISKYIRIKDVKTDKEIPLPQNGAVITQKLAKKLSLSVGDTITVNMDNGYKVNVAVSAISQNYAFHYMYMSNEAYRSAFATNPRYNYICSNFSSELTPEQKGDMAKDLLREYEINAISYADEIQSMFENTLDSIGYIVIVMVVSAGLLALIVLYNLSIMNINERVKEIATIKVLGFDNFEVSQYIFRENLLLTILGTILGLFVGIALHRIVVMVAEVSIITYGKSIGIMSFIYAAVLSLGFSLLVNLILRKTLRRVNMVESLKSNE